MAVETDTDLVLDADGARRELCDRLATAMRAGVFRFQLRFLQKGDHVGDVWFYTHQSHEWHKRDDLAFSSHLGRSLWDQMEMVSSREVADYGDCRRIDHPDRTDIELTFHREGVESHLTGDLESYLNGLLFYGHHESRKDSRRRMGFRSR